MNFYRITNTRVMEKKTRASEIEENSNTKCIAVKRIQQNIEINNLSMQKRLHKLSE